MIIQNFENLRNFKRYVVLVSVRIWIINEQSNGPAEDTIFLIYYLNIDRTVKFAIFPCDQKRLAINDILKPSVSVQVPPMA
jgi:hypothetical protein